MRSVVSLVFIIGPWLAVCQNNRLTLGYLFIGCTVRQVCKFFSGFRLGGLNEFIFHFVTVTGLMKMLAKIQSFNLDRRTVLASK